MRKLSTTLIALLAGWSFGAAAIDDMFEKRLDNMNGFLVVNDATYLKECGSCHFAYSPGLLPAGSWTRIMARADKHFGENLSMTPGASEAISRYLADNAADKSPYNGSRVLMEDIDPNSLPSRVMTVPRLRKVHRVMREVLARNTNVKTRTFTNCDGCHQAAALGDFSLMELRVDGLTGIGLVKSKNYKDTSIMSSTPSK